jgi:hypothetical protein
MRVGAIIWGTISLLLFTAIWPAVSQGQFKLIWPLLIFTCFIVFFLVWIWFGTYYQITQTHLYFRSGPFNGKIALEEIRDIRRVKYLMAGYRPALDFNGLLIKYTMYDEIYISPEEQDEFVSLLLRHIGKTV